MEKRKKKIGGLRAFYNMTGRTEAMSENSTPIAFLVPVSGWPDRGPTSRDEAKKLYLKLELSGPVILMREACTIEAVATTSFRFKSEAKGEKPAKTPTSPATAPKPPEATKTRSEPENAPQAKPDAKSEPSSAPPEAESAPMAEVDPESAPYVIEASKRFRANSAEVKGGLVGKVIMGNAEEFYTDTEQVHAEIERQKASEYSCRIKVEHKNNLPVIVAVRQA